MGAGVALVAMAPSVIGWTIGPSLVASQLKRALPGASTVSVSGVGFGWMASQSIDSVTVSTAEGDSFAGSIEVQRGLIPLVVSGIDRATVSIAGTARTRLLQDGALGILSLQGPPSATPAATPNCSLDIQSLGIVFLDAQGKQVVGEIDRAKATVTSAADSITFDLKSGTRVGDLAGSIECRGSWTGTLDAGSLEFTVAGSNIPIPGPGTALRLESLDASVRVAGSGSSGQVRANAKIAGDQALASSLAADLSFEPAPSAAGSSRALPILAGSLTISNWPVSSLQAWAPSGMVLVDAIGPTMDVTLAPATAADPRRMRAALSSPQVSLSADLVQGGPTVRLEQVDGHASLDGSTLAALTGMDGWVGRTDCTLAGSFVDFGAVGDPSWDVGAIGFETRVTLNDVGFAAFTPSPTSAPSVSRWSTVSVGWAEGRVATTAMSQGLSVELAGRCQGIPFDLDLVARGIVSGDWSVEQAQAAFGPFDVGAMPGVDAVTASQLAQAGLGEARVQVQLDQWNANGGTARVSWTDAGLHGACPVAMSEAGKITLGPITTSGACSGALLEPWMGTSPSIGVGAIDGLVIDVAPLTLASGHDGSWSIVETEVLARVRVSSVAVDRAPGLSGPVSLSAVDLAATVELDQSRRSSGTLKASLASAGGAIAAVNASLGWSDRAGATDWLVEGSLDVAAGDRLASVLGAEEAAGVVAGAGSAKLAAQGSTEGWSGTAEVSFPLIRGTVSARATDGRIAISDSTITAAIDAKLLPALASGQPMPLPAQALRPMASGDSIPASVHIDAVTIVAGALRGEVKGTLALGPGHLDFKTYTPVWIGAVTANVSSNDAARGVSLSIAGSAGPSAESVSPFSADTSFTFERDASGSVVALRESTLRATLNGTLARSLQDWAWQGAKESVGLTSISDVTIDARLKRLPLTGELANRAVAIDLTMSPATLQLSQGAPITLAQTSLSLSAESLGTKALLTLTSGVTSASGTSPIAAHVTAYGLRQPDGTMGLKSARFDGHLAASAVPMRVADALLRLDRDLSGALGETLNLSIEALAAPAARDRAAETSFDVSLATPALAVSAPLVKLVGGNLVVTADQPATIKFEAPTAFRDQLLEGLNPILGSITQAPPIVLKLDSLRMPIDSWRTLDAVGTVTTGVVTMQHQNQILSLLKLDGSSTTIQGLVGPLHFAVTRGNLAYRDFVVGIGKYGTTWQTELRMAGDIDLTQDPPFARELSVAYPVASMARDLTNVPIVRGVAVQLSNLMQMVPVSLGEAASIRVDFTGKLDGSNRLEMKVRPAIDVERAGGGVLEGLGNLLRGK